MSETPAWMKSSVEQPPVPEIDTTVPQTARIWNYWLGGDDNFAVDRHVGEEIKKAFPEMVQIARANRAFLVRVVRYLTRDVGIRQFLDIGTGLPTANNTHEVAQAVAPESRIVYVDFDPLVLVHARALLTSTPEGATTYIDADLRETDTILREAAKTLDLTQPVGLMLLGILGHIPDYEEATSIVRRLMAGLPSGSYLATSDSVDTSEGVVEAARIWNQSANPTYTVRSPEQIAGYFEGLELVEPGVGPLAQWRPDPDAGPPEGVDGYGGLGRKP
ncbi:MAG TPA: SAM-dependent methyltransferase [Jiangellaceae bacterium]